MVVVGQEKEEVEDDVGDNKRRRELDRRHLPVDGYVAESLYLLIEMKREHEEVTII